MRWWFLKLRFLAWPSWREMECPHCGKVERARSGLHMTDQVGRHMRKFHPIEKAQGLRRMGAGA